MPPLQEAGPVASEVHAGRHWDYLLKVLARDTEDYARIHRQYLSRLPGVVQMQSSFALRTVVSTTAIPV